MPIKNFKQSQAAEIRFARALRSVARTSGHIVEAHVEGHKLRAPQEMLKALQDYSKLIDPWARRQASKMLVQVATKNKSAFTKQSKKLGKLIQTNVAEAEAGAQAVSMMVEQVELIKSIPLDAGLRAQELAYEAAVDGSRASEVAEELMRSTKVSESKANLIARTEVARANAAINQARSTAVGSTHYRWRNSGDAAVRDSHRVFHGKKLDGMVFAWNAPPTLDDGMTGHPGTFPNCRCYAEPIFDTEES